jgi:hypothetical protein
VAILAMSRRDGWGHNLRLRWAGMIMDQIILNSEVFGVRRSASHRAVSVQAQR